jgi:hypothetical protein
MALFVSSPRQYRFYENVVSRAPLVGHSFFSSLLGRAAPQPQRYAVTAYSAKNAQLTKRNSLH